MASGADGTASKVPLGTFVAIGGSATREVTMATKDKNSKKANEKKPAQRTLKEKRQAKKDKK